MRLAFHGHHAWNGAIALLSVITLAVGLPARVSAQTPTPAPTTFDLSDNGVVNDADAWMVAEAWSDLGETGACINSQYARRDVDGSGCIDVADVQAILALQGQTTDGKSLPRSSPNDVGKTFTVTSTSSDKDANPGDGVCAASSGACTFRAALDESNRSLGIDTVAFDIRKSDGSCPTQPTIIRSVGTVTEGYTTTNALLLDDRTKAGTIIDGYTQCNASPNSEQIAGNAKIMIELSGGNTTGSVGLYIISPNNTVRGLSIFNHGDNILLNGGSAINNRIEGNFIGTNGTNSFKGKGTATTDNPGIRLRNSASNNIIGGNTPAQRNILSGNAGDGVYMEERANNNRVIGNYIGLRQDGITRLSNGSDGMDINIGCQGNVIGGVTPAERNVIAGNAGDGIEFSHTRPPDRTTRDLKVIGNYIGVSAYGGKLQDASGKVLPFGNEGEGLTLEDQVRDYEAYNNVIANNGTNGIRIYYNVTNVYIHNNLIGIGPNGEPLPNGTSTDPKWTIRGNNGIILLADANKNLIELNVIAYNKGAGIMLSNAVQDAQGGQHQTDYNTFSRNSIFSNEGPGIGVNPSGNDYPNLGIKAPTISSADTTVVTGTTLNTKTQTICAGCKIELFISDQTPDNPLKQSAGEGKTFVGAGTTDGFGNFSIQVTGVSVGDKLTATLTDTQGNTSEFAKNVTAVKGPDVPPTPTPTSTVPTPTPTIDPVMTPAPTTTATPVGPNPTRVPGPEQSNRTVYIPISQR